MGETAVVVLIPEAEPVVSADRFRYDWSAARGVPAHVTILYPFRPELDELGAATVETICRSREAFQVTFRSAGRFPGQVVWLRPDPSEPFSALIDAFISAFPECPPYGGQVSSPVPHLTVADGVDECTADELERKLIVGLPVSSVVERLTLLVEGADGRWGVGRSWPLVSSPR
jgi:2'-5' RNA ligase